MKTVRCFLAINLELESVKKITKAQRQLIDATGEEGQGIKWVPPQNMHITIRFLGSITEPMISAVKDHLEQVTRKTSPFAVQALGFGSFSDDSGNPRVLHIDVKEDGDALSRFNDAVCTVLEETGFKHDERPFHPHITIGRVSQVDEAQVSSLLSSVESADFGESVVSNLVCYQSVLSREGADYKVLWKLPLAGRRRTERNQNRAEQEPQRPSVDAEAKQAADGENMSVNDDAQMAEGETLEAQQSDTEKV